MKDHRYDPHICVHASCDVVSWAAPGTDPIGDPVHCGLPMRRVSANVLRRIEGRKSKEKLG